MILILCDLLKHFNWSGKEVGCHESREPLRMRKYFSHAAYIRWYRQYQINFNQIRSQFEAMRFPVATIPFPEQTRQLLQEETDEIDIVVERLVPRSFLPGAKPLETTEIFIENSKLLLNFFLGLFRSSFAFDSIYEEEKRNVLRKYKDSNIRTKLINFRRHIDEAITIQMKLHAKAQGSESDVGSEMSVESKKEATA